MPTSSPQLLFKLRPTPLPHITPHHAHPSPSCASPFFRPLPSCPLLPAEYCCNGTVIEDEEAGKVLQLQGDQRKNVSAFLLGNELCKKDQIKVHGF